jgi:hypothetical protein
MRDGLRPPCVVLSQHSQQPKLFLCSMVGRDSVARTVDLILEQKTSIPWPADLFSRKDAEATCESYL